MQQFLFPDALAAEVKRRVEILNGHQAWLEGVMITLAQVNGSHPSDRVQFNGDYSGIFVMPAGAVLNAADTDTADTADAVDVLQPYEAVNGKRK